MEDRANARLVDVEIVDGRPFMDGGPGPLSADREAGARCSARGRDAQKEGVGLTGLQLSEAASREARKGVRGAHSEVKDSDAGTTHTGAGLAKAARRVQNLRLR